MVDFFITIDFRTHCILFPYLGHIQIKYRMQKPLYIEQRPQVSTQRGGQVGVAVEISSAALFSCHNGREFCTGCKVLAFRAKRFRSREDEETRVAQLKAGEDAAVQRPRVQKGRKDGNLWAQGV